MPDTPKKEKAPSFEEYVKEHGEEEAVPFDDVLRRAVAAPPKHKPKPKKETSGRD